MADILMFGGSGIISTDIVNLSLKKGHRVTVVNRGKHKQYFEGSVITIISDVRNESIEDVRKKITGEYDVIFDFLSYTPEELKKIMTISSGLCKQYIYFSSSTVYNSQNRRYEETDGIGDSGWSYAVNKSICEGILKESASEKGFNYTIIRPYVTYSKTRIPLQFAPLEYYTIINRMKCGKCIPIVGKEIACTMTYSKDFAYGAVGLIMNPNAFGVAVHITGQYESTWDKALILEAKAFGQECDIAYVPIEALSNKKYASGLNADEVLSDKSRPMLFNNSLIKSLSPEFKGETSLEEALPEIVRYFSSTENRKINYAWDGRIDRMLIASQCVSPEQRKKLRFASSEKATMKDRVAYYVNRYEILYRFWRWIKKHSR